MDNDNKDKIHLEEEALEEVSTITSSMKALEAVSGVGLVADSVVGSAEEA